MDQRSIKENTLRSPWNLENHLAVLTYLQNQIQLAKSQSPKTHGETLKKEKGLYPSSRLNGYIHQLPVMCKNISTKSDRHITRRCWGSRAIQPNKMDNQPPLLLFF